LQPARDRDRCLAVGVRPAGPSAAEAQAFDELVESLQGLRALGWIELEVSKQAGHVGMYRRRYIAAVARCTDDGRQAIRLLGKVMAASRRTERSAS
jgi:hypothetical protein